MLRCPSNYQWCYAHGGPTVENFVLQRRWASLFLYAFSFKGRNPWGKRRKYRKNNLHHDGTTCNLSDVEQQGDPLKKSTKPWTLQTWMAGDDDGDWTVFGGSQQSLPWCCGLMDAISSGAYRIHPGSFREGRKKFKPNEGWPHLGRDDFLTDFWMNETYIYVYIYIYIYIYMFLFFVCACWFGSVVVLVLVYR